MLLVCAHAELEGALPRQGSGGGEGGGSGAQGGQQQPAAPPRRGFFGSLPRGRTGGDAPQRRAWEPTPGTKYEEV
jgi:hypothetical protein